MCGLISHQFKEDQVKNTFGGLLVVMALLLVGALVLNRVVLRSGSPKALSYEEITQAQEAIKYVPTYVQELMGDHRSLCSQLHALGQIRLVVQWVREGRVDARVFKADAGLDDLEAMRRTAARAAARAVLHILMRRTDSDQTDLFCKGNDMSGRIRLYSNEELIELFGRLADEAQIQPDLLVSESELREIVRQNYARKIGELRKKDADANSHAADHLATAVCGWSFSSEEVNGVGIPIHPPCS